MGSPKLGFLIAGLVLLTAGVLGAASIAGDSKRRPSEAGDRGIPTATADLPTVAPAPLATAGLAGTRTATFALG